MPVLYWGTGTINECNLIGVTGDHGRSIGLWNTCNDVIGSTSLNAGTWYHIAAVYDGLKRTLYLNGVKEMFGPYTSNSTEPLATVATPLHVGQYLLTSAWGNGYFDGAIDEIRIWNKARTGDQITADMNRSLTGKEPGLVHYYCLDEGLERIAKDIAGSNNLVLGSSDNGADVPKWINGRE
jgi:hypothetical protein